MNIKMGMAGWQWVRGGSSRSVLGRGPGGNGCVAVGSKETLWGCQDVSVRRWEEPMVSLEFCACEWAFERRGPCGDSTDLVAFRCTMSRHSRSDCCVCLLAIDKVVEGRSYSRLTL